jgi:hypothetical protein
MNKRCAIGNTAVMPSPERGLTPSIKRSEDELLPIATGSVAGGFHGQVAAIAYKPATNAQAMDNSSRFSTSKNDASAPGVARKPSLRIRDCDIRNLHHTDPNDRTSEAAVCSFAAAPAKPSLSINLE